MGFDIFGWHIFDLREPFSYIEVFSTMIIVLLCALVLWLILRNL